MSRMTNDDLIKLGFKPIPHFTVQNSVIYDLGRNRHLSAGDVGTPNEMIFIGEIDSEDDKKITDCICLHNYDYDGYVTEQKVKLLIEALTNDLWFKGQNRSLCGCLKCSPNVFPNIRFNVCSICGNKRCPHASDHNYECTNSNDVGQTGSVYKKSYKDLYNDYLTEIQFNNRIQFKIPFCEWLDNKFN